MKDDVSQEKKPGQHDEQDSSDSSIPSYQPFSKDDADDDFEILDALEHMGQAANVDEDSSSDDGRMIELTLDDEDIIFGEEGLQENSGFRFDENISADLEEELLHTETPGEFDTSVEKVQENDILGDSFVLDLDQEDKQEGMDLSFDQDVELNLDDTRRFDASSSEMAFDLNGEDELGFMSSPLEIGTDEAGEFDLDLDLEQNHTDFDQLTDELDMTESDFSFDLDLDKETDEDILTDTGMAEIDVESGAEDLLEASDISDGGDVQFPTEETSLNLGDFSEPEDLDTGLEDVEIHEDVVDVKEDMGAEDDNIAGMDFSDMGLEEEPDELQGKAVLSIGNDEVIDLGSEEDLLQSDDADAPSPPTESETATPLDMMNIPETEHLKKDEPIESEESLIPDSFVDTESTEAEQDEDFMASFESAIDDGYAESEDDDDFMSALGDINIDLEEDDTTTLPDQETDEMADLPDEFSELSREDSFDLAAEPEQEIDLPDEFDLNEDMPDVLMSDDMPVIDEEQKEADVPEERPLTEPAADTAEENIPEEQETSESEIDIREWLGLTLRLSDEQMATFEEKIDEAKTLQHYLDGLDSHKTEIKEKIHCKLEDEYISRKKQIFSEPSFISTLADVKNDLQEMLVEQAEFISTVERLNEELEEITVRHMVGEYDDSTLSDKEKLQKTEIALWNEKTEKIEAFITRYQNSLQAEQELNPLQTEEIPEEEPEAIPAAIQEEPESLVQEDILSSEESELEPIESEPIPIVEEDFEETEASKEPEVELEEESEEELEEEPEEELEEDGLLAEIETEIAETDEIEMDAFGDSEFSMENNFVETEVDLDELSKVAEEFVQDPSVSFYDIVDADDQEEQEQEEPQDDVIACKKCGRPTPASDKFCTHCGAKAK